jgi:archaellum component FlaC
LKLEKEQATSSNENSSTSSQKSSEIKTLQQSSEQKEKKPEPERKLIKFDTPEKPVSTKVGTPPDPVKKATVTVSGTSADTSREDLEQKRTMLQNMKDFDFMIKKNQEDITNISNKVESLSKDLDDLVSLYEIVSEQMNPFVGLSKVTKKRLDALENIIKEVDGVKNRIGDLESALDKPNGNINRTSPPQQIHTTSEPRNAQKTQQTQDSSPEQPPSSSMQPQPVTTEKISGIDLDNLLNTSLESVLTEQNIDMMINDFFISLK